MMKKSLLICLFAISALADERPNIVLIYSDDQGWGDVGYHGYDDIMTPNIDKLAKGGTQFSQGYVCASVCGPSRAGLLTGVYQQRMGVYGNWSQGGIPESQPTVFEMLKKEGYQTCAIGKWHVGTARETQRPNSRDVDFFYGFLWGSHRYGESSTDPNAPKHLAPIYRNTEIEPPIQESNGYLTEMFTDEAVGFIEQADKDKPFFVYLAYNAVHYPWDVPQPYIDRVQGLDTHDERKLFAGMVLCMDDGVGAIMEALEKKGVADNTLVVFMSDNGTPRGQGIKQPKQKKRGQCTMSNPGPFNGFKGDTYEGGIRVPFVMHWPGKIPADTTYDNPVINLDLVPTFLAAATRYSPPATRHSFDGVNLMPYITGADRGTPHDVLYWRRGEDYAIRKGDWKLVWCDSKDGSGSELIELFDMKNDPGEWKDLANTQPERAQMLQDLFDAWDSALADNQTGRNPKNRNSRYASGHRRNVAEYNANCSLAGVTASGTAESVGSPSADLASRPAAAGRSATVPALQTGEGRTLEEQLKIAEGNAKKKGKRFDAKRTARWFRAKDTNNDGLLSAEEQQVKAPVNWNSEQYDR